MDITILRYLWIIPLFLFLFYLFFFILCRGICIYLQDKYRIYRRCRQLSEEDRYPMYQPSQHISSLSLSASSSLSLSASPALASSQQDHLPQQAMPILPPTIYLKSRYLSLNHHHYSAIYRGRVYTKAYANECKLDRYLSLTHLHPDGPVLNISDGVDSHTAELETQVLEHTPSLGTTSLSPSPSPSSSSSSSSSQFDTNSISTTVQEPASSYVSLRTLSSSIPENRKEKGRRSQRKQQHISTFERCKRHSDCKWRLVGGDGLPHAGFFTNGHGHLQWPSGFIPFDFVPPERVCAQHIHVFW